MAEILERDKDIVTKVTLQVGEDEIREAIDQYVRGLVAGGPQEYGFPKGADAEEVSVVEVTLEKVSRDTGPDRWVAQVALTHPLPKKMEPPTE